jgi:hypothetical protein
MNERNRRCNLSANPSSHRTPAGEQYEGQYFSAILRGNTPEPPQTSKNRMKTDAKPITCGGEPAPSDTEDRTPTTHSNKSPTTPVTHPKKPSILCSIGTSSNKNDRQKIHQSPASNQQQYPPA